jgi:hypothetical protein
MGLRSAERAIVTAPPNIELWSDLARGWPIELGPHWLSAEWARVTPRSTLTFGDRAAASWLMIDGNEERQGYVAYDLLLDYYVDEALRDAALTTDLDQERCARVRERAMPLRTARTATIATISSYFPGIVWDLGLGDEAAERAVHDLVDRVRAAARDQSAAVLAVSNVPPSDPFAPLRAVLAGMGFIRTESAPDSELTVSSGGFNAYASAMRPSMRTVVRREQRTFAQAIDRVATEDASRLAAPDLVPLLMRHHTKYGHAGSEASFRDRLVRMSSHGANVRVLVAEKAGQAIGFTALVLDSTHGRLVPRLFACDVNDVFAYFNLVFYELVRVGASWGFNTIALGSTAYRAKLLRGAQLRGRSTWLLPLDEDLRAIIEESAAYRNEVEAARRAALTALER